MPYVTSVERIGREQGIEKGVDLALRLLTHRCGAHSIAQQDQVRSQCWKTSMSHS
jgi:hypothetical protein